MSQRLTMKLSGGARLLVEHVDLDGSVSEERFREAARLMAEHLRGERTATRPGAARRKRAAARAEVDV